MVFNIPAAASVLFTLDEFTFPIPLAVQRVICNMEHIPIEVSMGGDFLSLGSLHIQLSDPVVKFSHTDTIILNRIENGLVVRSAQQGPNLLCWSRFDMTGEDNVFLKMSRHDTTIRMETEREYRLYVPGVSILTFPTPNVYLLFERSWQGQLV
jgi:hypothetical protein